MKHHIFNQLKKAKQEGWLSAQAYKTIVGQLRSGDIEGADKGFQKLKRKAQKTG